MHLLAIPARAGMRTETVWQVRIRLRLTGVVNEQMLTCWKRRYQIHMGIVKSDLSPLLQTDAATVPSCNDGYLLEDFKNWNRVIDYLSDSL